MAKTDYRDFQQNVLYHYRHPQNKGTMEKPTVTAQDNNPLCGDNVRFQLRIKDGRVVEAMFEGQGCAISQAAASLLSEEIKGKTLKQVERLDKADVSRLVGIELSPVRLRCALLPLRAILVGVYEHEGNAEQVKRVKREIG